ncbi:cupin [Ilumatobacter sp.]|uniref:cupin n=1 Tax=Ilumatobacter sp. TaxID=1967498 RepID=UPI003C38E9F6
MSDVIEFSSGDFVHLGLGATTIALPRHTGDVGWYEEYGQQHAGDGVEGRLVSLHTFSESWDTWEMHPKGSELVLCVAGTIELTQETPDGTTSTVTISAGQAVVNEPGVWHTADVPDVADPPTVVFITAGEGTEMRPR